MSTKDLEFEIPSGLGSDNHSGAHPVIIEALLGCNKGHMPSYGTDPVCKKAIDVFKDHFGRETEVFFVFNGTAANTLSLKSLTKGFHSVLCAQSSHINQDECGAPEAIANCKVIPLPSPHGKISIDDINRQLIRFGDVHFAQPKVISLTQPTELGTLYEINEIKSIAELAHRYGLYLHIDGARLVNAAAALNVTFKELTSQIGVDVVTFGGTKNGLVFGEAILFLKPELAKDFSYVRKQGMQLPSKSRFIAAQFLALFENNLWKENALHSIKMARLLESEIKNIKSIQVTQKVESNAVFARIPKSFLKPLRKTMFFYVWDQNTFEVRWMTSFDTRSEDIIKFIQKAKDLDRELFADHFH